MKKLNLIYVVGLLFFFGSCDDAIEIDQPGRLPAEQAYENVNDLELGLTGVYAQFDLNPEIYFTTIWTDEVSIDAPENGGQGQSDYGFVLNPSSAGPAVIWTSNYAAINAVNRVIEGAQVIEPSEGQQEKYNSILGQAYALRAFFYFQLQSYFTTDYADDSALGVPLVDYVPTINDEAVLRSTNGEIFAFIKDDLNKAEDLLVEESNATFVSQDFVTALRARMAAYRENYPDAATYASELLEDYAIADSLEYENIWEDEGNTEIIFELERTIGDNYDQQGASGSPAGAGYVGVNWAFTGPGPDGGVYYVMSQSLLNELNPADVRFNVLLHPESTTEVPVIDKYSGSESQPLMNDLKVFRASEMLLILAEAYVAMDRLEDAAALIKQLRDLRFGIDTVLPVFANKAEGFGAILDERRIELAYEGHRYKDLKRLGERGNRGIERAPADCAVNNACSLDVTDYRFTFPIPIVELTATPELRDQQNPGY
ncbi:RagB/SusD family nutrient uptake outer membrane protein [Salinimicrobium sp. WS361]|uniref:RagB/SusD family nutrient uptake outer membrane protein n=1 Tax=Salinimicrobium sp. WS361 TaxID=3425123 RepID=UPI003D6F4C1F